jgi:formate--tetrahydrofolate ligase
MSQQSVKVPPDIEIARAAKIQPIGEIAAKLGIPDDVLEPYGKYKAKVSLDYCQSLQDRPMGKLILVTAINPTPAGEGKTTTTVGLGDALTRIGKKAAICLREPSLGPCFGMKGGAAGGGYSQVVPMVDINLHFTGDFHAIGLANNLLSAMLDNHIYWGNNAWVDPRRISWRRVLDMNDRALRQTVVGLGGKPNGFPREDGFDITVASEVMAIFCLAESLAELKDRLGKIVVGVTYHDEMVKASQMKCHGAMTVLLKDALAPNLVQTLEHTPAFIHGGPFANIAHGCNSVLATKLALRTADYTVTEAGFGADLGAEKFLNIKCRKAGLQPSVVVIVATVRALKMHGGMELARLKEPDLKALDKGIENLKKHIENIRLFGLPAVVAINAFTSDTPDEIQLIKDKCDHLGVPVVRADHWAKGGAGAEDLAKVVVQMADGIKSDFKFLYPDNMTLWSKVKTIAQKIYGANDILADKKLRSRFKELQELGFGHFPICMAKTQYSLSTDPGLRGRPTNFDVPLRDIRLSAGAGFLVVLTGEIMTMPGLPKHPAAEMVDLDDQGNVVGFS